MLKRLLATLGFGTAPVAAAAPPYAPYADDATNAIYNLLFCDDMAAFLVKPDEIPTSWQALLSVDRPEVAALSALAADSGQEGRIRALAFGRLRALGHEVPKGILLGVITEVGLDSGLDTLAAYSDGGVRYINQSGEMAFVEGRIEQTKDTLPKLFAAGQHAVDRLKPLEGPRWAPPPKGTVRFTFLTSDGLYFGQGPMSAMQRDAMGSSILEPATELLLIMVKLGAK
jgi:hypothetical protein